MKILIIGGTSFIGRHITLNAKNKGHDITLFNRGKSDPSAFPDLKMIKGDRQKDAHKLAGEKWDAVIDTSAYTPRDLSPVLSHIDTEHYTFVSTISVYDNFKEGPVDESGSVHAEVSGSEEVNGKTYGPLKMMCEKLLEENMAEKLLIVRPCIVAGPYDPTDRFTWWALSLSENRQVLIPGAKEREIQWIDARDLAEFVISNVEKKMTGKFNVASDPLSMQEFVEAVQKGNPEKVWASDEMLLENGVKPFEIPFWMPITAEYPTGFILVDNLKAKDAGLNFTSLKDTAEDTREWFSENATPELKAGLDKDKEKKILFTISKKSE